MIVCGYGAIKPRLRNSESIPERKFLKIGLLPHFLLNK